jgi:hypothetical protein
MSEFDRWGDSAAVALLNEVTPAETEEALAMVRAGGRGQNVDRRRWGLLALAAAAIVVLVGGLVVLKNRDTEEVEPPLASPPSTAPVTNPGTTNTTQVPATVPPTTPAPATAAPGTSAPVTTAPTTTDSPATTQPSTPGAIPPLADQPDFGGASKVAFAGDGEIIVAGSLQDGSPVWWKWSDDAAAWSSTTAMPGDNPFVPMAFVDSRIGFVFIDGYVQKTINGGVHWELVDIASPSGGSVDVIALAIGAGYVHALGVDQDGAMTFRLYTMPIDGDAFTASSVTFPPPAGGEPGASFAFDGESGWMAVTSRTLMGAARFSGGEWSEDSNVTCVNGGVTYASSGEPGDLVRSCDSGFMGSDGSVPEATQIQVSSDAGQTFGQPLTLPTGGSPFFTLLARPAVGTIIIGGQGDSGPLITHDEGATWQPLGLPTGSFVSDIEASSFDLWVAVGSTSSGDQKVWVSRDGGATWAG